MGLNKSMCWLELREKIRRSTFFYIRLHYFYLSDTFIQSYLQYKETFNFLQIILFEHLKPKKYVFCWINIYLYSDFTGQKE